MTVLIVWSVLLMPGSALACEVCEGARYLAKSLNEDLSKQGFNPASTLNRIYASENKLIFEYHEQSWTNELYERARYEKKWHNYWNEKAAGLRRGNCRTYQKFISAGGVVVFDYLKLDGDSMNTIHVSSIHCR